MASGGQRSADSTRRGWFYLSSSTGSARGAASATAATAAAATPTGAAATGPASPATDPRTAILFV